MSTHSVEAEDTEARFAVRGLPEHYSTTDRMFHDKLSPFIVRFRLPLVLWFVCITALAGYRTMQLHVSDELPQFFTRDSNLQRFLDWRSKGVYKEGSYSVANTRIIWGCDNVADSGKTYDQCGVCGGDCLTCALSCDGVKRPCDKIVKADKCGVCGGDGLSCVTTSTSSTLPSTTPTTTAKTRTKTTAMITTATSTGMSKTTTTSTLDSSTATVTATTMMTTSTTMPCKMDLCGVCEGMNECVGCDGLPHSNKAYDQCGVCSGNNACVGCDSVPFSNKVVDVCGVCGGNGKSCFSPLPTPSPTPALIVGCDGIANSIVSYDKCGVCGGSNACIDCKNVVFGTSKLDPCGICNGDGSSCLGCTGLHDFSKVDMCGVCQGHDECIGCDGSMNTNLKYDACGVCNGTSDCVPIKPLSANLESMWFMWGVSDIDRSKADINNPFDDYIGDPIYDETFDFSDPTAQRAIDNALYNLTRTPDLIVRGHEATFFNELKNWLAAKGYPFPIPKRFNTSLLLAQFIIKNPGYDTLIGFSLFPLQARFVRARMLSTVDSGDSALFNSKKYDAFLDQLSQLSDVAPDTSKHVMLISDYWIRCFTELVAVNGVKSSVALSVFIAIVALTIFTGNIIVSFYAIVSICANILFTLALYDVWGWSLGVVEAISISILIGLSVDYTFHVAESYSISHEPTRKLRTTDALTHTGSSVLSGALTTAGAAYFLLFCEIQIFHKFGVIVVVNTSLSVLYTIFFFSAMLALGGPQGNIGSIAAMARWILRCGRLAPPSEVVHRLPLPDRPVSQD